MIRRVVACLLLGSLVAFAETPKPRSYVCYRANGAVTIEGSIEDAAWSNIPWTESFVDIEGDIRPRPRFATRVKMMWDDQFFYIAAELNEPHLWATITKHDAVIFHDNDFEVFIDPDGDNHNYGEIEINALNTVWDLRLPKPYRDSGKAEDAWEVEGLKTAVKLKGTLNNPRDIDTGWTVEMALPWKAFAKLTNQSLPPRDGDQWRVNFSRVEWQHEIKLDRYVKVPKTREDNWVWSPQGVIDMHRPERWGYVQFSRGEIGKVEAKSDPLLPARDQLMVVYLSQKAFFATHKRWAATLDELKIAPALPVQLKPTADGYVASATVTIDGQRRTVSVQADSRISVTP